MNKRFVLVSLFLCISFVYSFSTLTYTNIFSATLTNYFPYFIDALFHGRVNIIHPPSTFDLSLFQGKWYLNWGPATALYVLPFYLLWGINASDVFFTLIAGIANVILFYFLMKEFQKYFHLQIGTLPFFFVLLTFAFCSPNFYLSLAGRIWHTEQIVAIFFLLISYLFYFRYLNKQKMIEIFISIIFFNLAWASRYTLIFSGFLFLYPLFLIYKDKGRQIATKFALIILMPCLFTAFLIMGYNVMKFQNPLQTGLAYHLGHPRFAPMLQNHQFFSLSYIPYNLYYYFLNPPRLVMQHSTIGLFFDTEGIGMFFMYPSLLFLLLLLRKKQRLKKINIVPYLFTIGFVVCSSLLLYLFYFTTGWTQIGLRYLFDIIPLLYLILLFVIETVPYDILLWVFVYELIINILAIMNFYG